MRAKSPVETPMRTPLELATALGLSPITVTKFCREGQISSIKVGKLYRIPASEFARVLREGVAPVLEREAAS